MMEHLEARTWQNAQSACVGHRHSWDTVAHKFVYCLAIFFFNILDMTGTQSQHSLNLEVIFQENFLLHLFDQ